MLTPNVEASQDAQLAELVRQVNASQGAIGLSVDGQQQAVILSIEAFKQLLSGKIYAEHGQLFEPEFRQQFQQALEPIRKPELPLSQCMHKLNGSSPDSFLYVFPIELAIAEIDSSMNVFVRQPIFWLCSSECHE
jgi:hypothetical protein